MIYNLGRVVPLFKGNYDAATTYGFLDVVYYDNSSFVALDTTTGNLPTDTSHWLPVALKGLTQNPTPAQMQQIISEVEQYMYDTDFVYDPDYTHIDVINNLTSTSTTNALSANQGKVLNETIDDVSHSVSDLTNTVSNLVIDSHTSTSTTNALSANQGKVLYDLIDDVSHSVFDLENNVSNLVVDNLNSNDGTKALSAKQGNILNNSKVEVSIGSNIFDISKALMGSIIKKDGTFASGYSEYGISDYIPVNGQSIIGTAFWDNLTWASYNVYDSNFGLLRTIGTGQQYTYVSGDAYVRMSFHITTSVPNPHANYGTTLLDYEPYNPIKGYLGDITDIQGDITDIQGDITDIQGDITDIQGDLTNKVDFNSVNILDPTQFKSGYILNSNGTERLIGTSGGNLNYKYTLNYIPVNGQSITIHGALADNSNNSIVVYNANKVRIRNIVFPSASGNNYNSTFTPQEGDAYIRINLYQLSSVGNLYANYGDTIMSEYQPYNPISGYLDGFLDGVNNEIDEIQSEIATIENPNFLIDQFKSIFNSVICIGDSMTAGWRAGQGDVYSLSYPAFMAKMSGWNVENTGTGGQTPIGWYANKFPLYTYTDYDVAIIYLGQNQGLTNTLNSDTFDGTQWAANTSYSVGTIVQYNRIGKKCIEAHTSGDSFDATKWTDAYTDYSNTNTGRYCSIIEGMLVQNPKLIIFLLSGTAVSNWNSGNGVVINQISARYGNLPVFNIKDNPWVDLHKLEYHPHYSSGTTTDYIHYGTIGYLSLGRVIYSYILKYINEHQSEFTTYKEN